jgi:3-hydroxybutyryl-CoA dehydrogenase
MSQPDFSQLSQLNKNSTIAVIGAGTMGAGIAQIAANAGHQVLLFDSKIGASAAGIDSIAKGLAKLVARGRKTAVDVEKLLARITPCDKIEQLANTHLAIEAIVENLAVKQSLFKQLQALCNDDTILATNTSSISVTAIAAELERPEQLVGMHFFNPAPIMKLVEVISGIATSLLVAEQVYALAITWGKKPVYAKSTPGFIVNRVARPFYAEALRTLQEGGANVATIDAIMRECGGFRMGPLELTDLIGHDVNYAVTQSVFDAFYQDPRFTPSLMQRELVNAGFLGRKSGRGFYHYQDTNLANNIVNEQENIVTAPIMPPPKKIIAFGSNSAIVALVKLAQEKNIQVDHINVSEHSGIQINDTWLTQTDGRFVTQYEAEGEKHNCVFFDLALDYAQAPRLAITKSMQCSEAALNDAIGFLQVLNKAISVIEDVPGMIVMRTVCMLANEGADTVNQQVCSIEAVDIAMQAGVNYPRGPLQWADDIGIKSVVAILNNIAQAYGEDRYRVSPLLVKYAYAQHDLHH